MIFIKNINYVFIKLLISLFLLSVFSYVFYFSLNNIINYWTYSEIHINYSLGFSKRGLLGSMMLYLETIGFPKNIFFSLTFYLVTLCNIFLFLNLINKFKKNHKFFYIFFALNPALLLFSFYDLGGYARAEIFGISVSLLHTLFAQKVYYNKMYYQKYLKISFTIIYPLSFITILIHELNTLFLFFHFFTTLLLLIKYKFKGISHFKNLVFLNFISITFIILILIAHPFTKEFAQELYNNLQSKSNTSFWIWRSIAGSFSERLNYEINYMLNPSGTVLLYFSIFIYYAIPIFFLLTKTSEVKKIHLIYAMLSILPFIFLFFVGRDWGRWIHIIIFVIFLCLIQFKEKKINLPKNYNYKILTYIFIIFVIFQFIFTRIPHCCNLVRLNLNIFGGIIPKVEALYKIFNNNYDLRKRFETY